MSKSELLGKVLSQVGIFVVSALLAGMLLLAIQANKLPGIIQKDYYYQNDDDVTTDDNQLPDDAVEAPENTVTTAFDSLFSVQQSDIDNETISVSENTFSSHHNPSLQQNPQENQINPDSTKSSAQQIILRKPIITANTNTITNTKTKGAQTVSIPATGSKTFTPAVSAAFGFSPVFFTGQSFVQDYFQNKACVFTPCAAIGLVFPRKNNFSYALYLSAASSSLKLNASNISQKLNLDFSTTLLLVKLDFSILHTVFTNNNLLEAHLGTGVGIFAKPICSVNELSFNRKNVPYITLDFGFSFKHFFSDKFFIAALCDITYILPYSEKIILIQPAVTAGLNL